MPTKIFIPNCLRELLRTVYPTVNWSRVTFYQGLPWFTQAGTLAITLPDDIDPTGINIYLKDINYCDCDGIATFIHESFHVLQYMDLGNAYGIGYMRLFMICYLACTFKNGYDNNPMEAAAYAQENKFLECCKSMQITTGGVCDCSKSKERPAVNYPAIDFLKKNCPGIIAESSGFKYNCGFWWFVLAAIVILIIAILKPIIEIILWIINLIIDILTFIVNAIIAIVTFIIDLFKDPCAAGWKLEKQCTDWAEKSIQECNQYEDQGYNECTQSRDDGYNACSRTEDHGYNQCCDWWPCSWACKAWVWISNIVCVAYTWVSNIVCVVWTWIQHLVCIVWVTVVSWVCKAFTWVIKKIFC